MKVEFRIAFENKIYLTKQLDYDESELMDFLDRLEKDRAKTISEIPIDAGEDGETKGIDSIALYLGKEAAERTGVFVMTFKDKEEKK